MRRAEELLYGELAVALDIPRERVQAYIHERLNGPETLEAVSVAN